MDSGNRAVQQRPTRLRGSSSRANQGAGDPRGGQSGETAHALEAGGWESAREKVMAIAIAIKIFGRADKGASRPSLALPGPWRPRGNVGGGRGAGDCKGRCATSWPCLSPQLLPLLTKIKANRDKREGSQETNWMFQMSP